MSLKSWALGVYMLSSIAPFEEIPETVKDDKFMLTKRHKFKGYQRENKRLKRKRKH